MPMRVPETKAEKRKRRGYVRKGEMLDREDGRFMPFAKSLANKLAGAGIKGDVNDPNYLTFVEAVSKALASTSGKGRNLLDVALAVAKTHAPPRQSAPSAPRLGPRAQPPAAPPPAMQRPAPVDGSPFPPVPGWNPGASLPARPSPAELIGMGQRRMGLPEPVGDPAPRTPAMPPALPGESSGDYARRLGLGMFAGSGPESAADAARRRGEGMFAEKPRKPVGKRRPPRRGMQQD